MEKINSVVETIKSKYAPDRRVAIFNITVEKANSTVKLTGDSNSEKAITELVETLATLDLNVENDIELLPNKKLGSKIYGIVNLSVANIRSKPKHPAELATQSLLGTCVNVLKERNGWFLIQTPDDYISWVDDDGITLVDEDGLNDWKSSSKIVITEQYTIAYDRPNSHSSKISDLVVGDILQFVKKTNGFVQVKFPDGRLGFVNDKYVENYNKWVEAAFANGKTIIGSALDFVGLPYLWGGTSAKGFDCSGFTKTVYYLNGVILPRDASQQVNVGKTVDTKNKFNNLLPGDLLFFGRRETEKVKEKITHVAIYIGDLKFIHSSGRVKINSLDKNSDDFSQYRFNTFIRAKRIIGNFDKGENLLKNNKYYN